MDIVVECPPSHRVTAQLNHVHSLLKATGPRFSNPTAIAVTGSQHRRRQAVEAQHTPYPAPRSWGRHFNLEVFPRAPRPARALRAMRGELGGPAEGQGGVQWKAVVHRQGQCPTRRLWLIDFISPGLPVFLSVREPPECSGGGGKLGNS